MTNATVWILVLSHFYDDNLYLSNELKIVHKSYKLS
jgi:hypothetical protein